MVRPSSNSKRFGSILLLVLIAVAMMSLTIGSYLTLMQNEHTATRYGGRRLQARMLVESGVEYLLALLDQDSEETQSDGSLLDNEELMRSILVADDKTPAFRGRFTVLANDQSEGQYHDLRYGLENESAKLNLNTLVADDDEENDTARERLLAIPGIDSEVADSILDWLDSDDSPREFGAEQSHYRELSPAYRTRNGPLVALDELLMVKGVTAELLYGYDTNRSYLVDDQELPARGALEQLENNEGELNRGISAYLTLHSLERLVTPEGKRKINVNNEKMRQLFNRLRKVISKDEATFIVAYRQYGPAADGAPGNSAAISAVKLDWKKEPQTKITSLFDLVGARVSVPAKKENDPPQVLDSPWQDDQATYSESFSTLLDYVAINSAKQIAGRVNLGEATRPVLQSIPGMTEIIVDQILSHRDGTQRRDDQDSKHPLWLLTEGIVTLEEMKQIAPYITLGGDVFSAQVIGYFEETTPRARAEVVLDRSGKTPRIVSWQELSQLGPGVARSVLGDELENRK
ncbi:MAG: general secretion pathway protein GspK [Planctomycetales bacterium]|nr:general secretion pathway protein GspK [Planctomycetales bacterium]